MTEQTPGRSDTVVIDLGKIHIMDKEPTIEDFQALEPGTTIFQTEAGVMLEALKSARVTIKALHGPVGWKQYQHSPEMQRINAALGRAKAP